MHKFPPLLNQTRYGGGTGFCQLDHQTDGNVGHERINDAAFVEAGKALPAAVFGSRGSQGPDDSASTWN